MNIDRYMVNLFFEIKRNLPITLQKDLKISAPDLGDTMMTIYAKSDDENIKLLIEVFMERAGGKWLTKLAKKSSKPSLLKKIKTKKEIKPPSENTTKGKSKMIYRGQEVFV